MPNTLDCPVRKYASTCPDHPALLSPHAQINYRELNYLIDKTASNLYQSGISAGDVVGLQAAFHPHFIYLIFALLRLRAIALPLNYRFPMQMQQEILSRCGAKNLIHPEKFLFTKPVAPYPEKILKAPTPYLYLLTSGSSGFPKIAVISFANCFYSALGVAQAIRLDSQDRYLLSLPCHHIGGLAIVFRTFFCGATLVLPSSDVSRQIQKDNISHLSLVPTQLYRIMQKTSHFPSLKSLLLGGAPNHLKTSEQKFLEAPLLYSYGMTEMSSTISLGPIASGSILPYRQVHIHEDHEIFVKGPTLFLGYLEKGKISRPVSSEGWFATKDLGKIRKDGSLEIIGRKDRLFICAGENCHPEEIEMAIYQAERAVKIAAVVPVPNPEYGFRPAAFIKSDFPFHEARIKENLRKFLPPIKIPIRILPLPDKALTGMKVNYLFLKNMALKSSGIGML
ncbi:MAG: o-succinylbenzoate--CoA ligase [Simkaniaceae bacterium]